LIVIYQFSEYHYRKINRITIFLSPLLPYWHLFAPEPLEGDFIIHYDVFDASKQIILNDKQMEMPERAFFYSLFFNKNKVVLKITNNLCKNVIKNGDSRFDIYNISIINYINNLIRIKNNLPEIYYIKFRIFLMKDYKKETMHASKYYQIKRNI